MNTLFVTRELGKNGAEITREEFVQMMITDIAIAKVEYRKYSDEKAEETYQKDCEHHKKCREQKIQEIIDDSFKKYKREYYRRLWVDSEMRKVPSAVLERNRYTHFGHDLDSIKWDIRPWENGCRIFNVVINLEERLGNLYDEAIQNKYFRNCTGWSIVEEGFSTRFKLHLSENFQKEWEADEKRLADDIARFYADCRYCGD